MKLLASTTSFSINIPQLFSASADKDRNSFNAAQRVSVLSEIFNARRRGLPHC